MAKPLAALDYLASPAKHPVKEVCVLFGDEAFLKRQVLAEMRREVGGGDDAEFAFSTFSGGPDLEWKDLNDALATVAMFGGERRFVVLEETDRFLSKTDDELPATAGKRKRTLTKREQLEDYVAHPSAKNVLVLDAKTWPTTTKLYKALTETGLQIDCSPPPPAQLVKWLGGWAKQKHNATLPSEAAEQLVEIVGPEMGLLDQELAKLALLAPPANDGRGLPIVTAELVRDNVGGWRAKSAWDMLDAAADGHAREALAQLDRLLASGEAPVALLGQIASSLRRFTAATRLIQHAEADKRKVPLSSALEQVGVKTWPVAMQKAERQLKQLGRDRAGQMLHWLLDADLALKGTHSKPHLARFVLEQLIAKMGKQSK